ncbi:MAG: GlmU family protein [Saprospiraceae bacterium]|nr:GlmU family protein [Saprospiraceae bacterium]
MRNLILFDSDDWKHLLPLTYTRPMAELRCGILRIREKWELLLDAKASHVTQEYLSDKYPATIADDNWLIHGGALPTENFVRLVRQLVPGEALLVNDELVAARLEKNQFDKLMSNDEIGDIRGFGLEASDVQLITRPWQLFSNNKKAIQDDFELLTANRKSQPIPPGVVATSSTQIFIESGATLAPCYLNATEGPIYIGKNAEVMDGAMIRGPFALCHGSTVKMGAKIYGGTTIGPYSKAGGEISNSMILGYTNKGHDGFLGDSVIGEWCNMGADTNVSNLKNTYAEVRLWSYVTRRFEPTGLQFCGLIMGDHTKCGINTMFNTGTVIGVGANIYGDGFPRNFIPSFAWGGASGFRTFSFEKMIETVEAVFKRRQKKLIPDDIVLLRKIYEDSAEFRSWERHTEASA